MHKAIKFIVHILSMTPSLLHHDSGWLILIWYAGSQPIDVIRKCEHLRRPGGNNNWSRPGVCDFDVPWFRLFAIIALSFHSLFFSSHLSYAPRPTYSIFVNSISQVCNQACRAAECWTPQITAAWIAATMQVQYELNLYFAIQPQYVPILCCHDVTLHWVKGNQF